MLRITDNYTLQMLCGAPHNVCNEENQTQSNPGTGAPINAIGQWLWSIVCWMHSQVR